MADGDLCQLSDLKAYLGLSRNDDDALLATLISSASKRFLDETSRCLQATFTEQFDGNGCRSLLLPRAPVASVTSLAINGETIPERPSVGEDGWVLRDDQIHLVGYFFTKGTANVEVQYVAGWDTIPADVAFACLELAAWWFRGKEHIGIVSTTMQGAQTQYAGNWASEQNKNGIPASVAAVMSLYRIQGAI